MEHCRDTRDKFQFTTMQQLTFQERSSKSDLLFHEKLEYQFYPSGIKNQWCKEALKGRHADGTT